MVDGYVPDRGDLVWLSFDPQAGREQAGRRPALVLTERRYNQVARLMLCCPITSRVKGYPFEVSLPEGLPVSGVILVDHVRSVDWVARRAEQVAPAPAEIVEDVRRKLSLLI